ncbi:MAG: hypothetical protein MSG64_20365 [Pyrinomonadaceae bacterium MAG19_C2-C3]|nr:hypothetical protein [Pyrinomonadaceae bacterium MAG19_C2-C3]
MFAQLSQSTQQAYQPFYDEHAAGKCFAPQSPQDRDGEEDPVKCKVSVRLSVVDPGRLRTAATLGVTIYHAYIVTQQSNQSVGTGFRAGPSVQGGGGNLFAQTGRYDSRFPDYQQGTPPNASATFDGPCDNYNASFNDTAARTNNSAIPYARFSNNSNAFAFTSLQRAGIDTGVFGRVLNQQAGTWSTIRGWGVTLPLR